MTSPRLNRLAAKAGTRTEAQARAAVHDRERCRNLNHLHVLAQRLRGSYEVQRQSGNPDVTVQAYRTLDQAQAVEWVLRELGE